MEADPDADPAVKGVAHKQAVAARTFAIGKVVDSADDMARLMIITQYDGSKSVKVYAYDDQGGANEILSGASVSAGRIQTDGEDTPDVDTDDEFVSLKSVGTYYRATTDDDATGNGVVANKLDYSDMVGAKAAAEEVLSYVDDKGNVDSEDDETRYVVLDITTTTKGVTTLTYRHVDITAAAGPPRRVILLLRRWE